MAILTDFSLIRFEDGIISFSLTNPTNITGWSVEFQVKKRFDSCSGRITKSADATFFNGQSGITFTNAAQGRFNVTINSVDTSGFDFGNYAYSIERQNAGNRTVLTTGFFLLYPSLDC